MRLLLLLALALLPTLAHAQDFAVLEIKFGKEKELRRVVIQLFPEAAPETAENFRQLIRKGFYKNQAFHRAIPDYLVQTGDPLSRRRDRTAVGTGGPGHTVPAEAARKHVEGAVAMARLPEKINPARVSNGSQFYVVLKAAPELDNSATVFGQVVEGLDVLREISHKPTDTNDYPLERILIRSTRLQAAAE